MNKVKAFLRKWLEIETLGWRAILLKKNGEIEIFNIPRFEYSGPPNRLKVPKNMCADFIKEDSQFIEIAQFWSHGLNSYSLEDRIAFYMEK